MAPNSFCYVALFGFLPVALIIFTRLRLSLAAGCVIFLGALFLPERVAYDPPLLPAFDKRVMASLAVFLGCIVFRARLFRGGAGRQIEFLCLLILAGLIGTSLTNPDPTPIGKIGWSPPMTLYEVLGELVRLFLTTLVPYLVGRSLFRESRDLRALLVLLVGFGLGYSLLALLEVRLSPQLHIWVYGFHQHAWDQAFRAGGYRPTVFMAHGLTVSLFFMESFAAALTLARAKVKVFRVKALLIAAYLFVVLILCKSMGSLVYGIVAGAGLLLFGAKGQLRLAFILALLAFTYPVLRIYQLFPTDQLVDIAAEYGGQERAASLKYRFDMDEMLIKRALERPYFGWGGFGRSALYESNGKQITVVDAQWTALFGGNGAVGFAGHFSVLILPIFSALRALKRIPSPQDRTLLAGLALIVAFNLIDQLVNSMQSTLPVLFAGAVSGCAHNLTRRAGSRAPGRS